MLEFVFLLFESIEILVGVITERTILVLLFVFSNIKNTVSQTPRASREKVEKLLLFLQNELTERGHFHELNKKPRMVKNMNNIFIRAGLTDQEVQTLYGVFRSLTNKKTEE